MLVLFVGADLVERFHAHDADDRAKDVALLKVKFDQLGGFPLDVLDRLLDVDRM